MRSERRWLLAGAAALVIGVIGAEPYARLAAPLYAVLAELKAGDRPWTIARVGVEPDAHGLGAELKLRGTVRRQVFDARPAARVIGRVQVGEVIETPLVFWTVLLAWPASGWRLRAVRALLGAPVYLGLEAATTTAQLMLPLAQASAILAGDRDPLTLWDRWSRFLEAGGQFVVVSGVAMILAALTARLAAPKPA